MLNLVNHPLLANGIDIVTSADKGSNAARSFIVIPANTIVLEGIKHHTLPRVIPQQQPIQATLTDTLSDGEQVQWLVRIPDKAYGRIKVYSRYAGGYQKISPGRLWQSALLDANTENRSILQFLPAVQPHQPPMYKKGRSKQNERRKFGGGTKKQDDYLYNPRIVYDITARIIKDNKELRSYTETIQQDDKDLLRQEYINHHDRERYGRGERGSIPVPTRDELTEVPEALDVFAGESISQSSYGIMVEDGMINLAVQVANAFAVKKKELSKNPDAFKDLNGKPLKISDKKLWLSSGWRNPERNEWYSNAINGIHQRGAAIDVIPNERPGTIEAATMYWVLWQALNDKRFNLPGYWQLESHGRPMRTKEYTQDISPKNGIPDAFDIADHAHIQSTKKQ